MNHAHRDFVRLVMALLVMLLSLPAAAVHAQTPGTPDEQANLFSSGPPPIPPFAPGVVLLGVREDGVSAAALLEGLEISAQESLDLRGLDGGQGTGGVAGLRLQVPPGLEWAVIERLQQQPGVVFAEPDWLAQIAEAPIAAETPAQSAAAETPFAVSDPLYEGQWFSQRINLGHAWALAQAAGADDPIRVVMVDTGVDYMHPDLENRLAAGRNYITNIPGVAPAPDDNGHGTHIAGLIGALTNNGKGMAGAALNVVLEPYKVFGASGVDVSSLVAQAVRDAVDADPPADIINLSLTLVGGADSTPLRASVAYAISKGALVIAAAGNCTTEIDCPVFNPAAYPGVLAVGATTYLDAPAYYSPRGKELALVAPGGGTGMSILSTWSKLANPKNCEVGRREVDGGFYCPKDGTSMAAALTSGVAALVWSMNRDLSAAQVGEILRSSAAPINADEDQAGAGRLDAAAALRAALPAQLTVSQNRLRVAVAQGSAPQQAALTLDNPSLDPITWTLSTTRSLDWLAVSNPAGSVRYGEPAQATLMISPTQLALGQHSANLLLTGSRSGGPQVQQMIAVDVIVHGPLTPRSHLPIVARQETGAWLQPGPEGRTPYTLTGSASAGITLPFAVEVHGQKLTEARLFADGFVTFPASLLPAELPPLPNRCLANQLWPQAGVYGWWADLEPGALGSSLSTFQPDPDRFVIEYAKVPSAAGVLPAYVVSFQIVLHRSGRIDLNYGALPDAQTRLQATVGVRVQAGRFYNQVACHTAGFSAGALPRSFDTITLEAKDLY